MKKIFTFAAAALVMAACSKEPVQTPVKDFQAPAEKAEKKAVEFRSNVTVSMGSKAQGGVDAWSGSQNLYVYGFQRVSGAIDYATATPFINNVVAVSPSGATSDNSITVLDETDGKPYYYVGNFTYDFYGYYVDDLDAEPRAEQTGIYVPLTLTGGEDIMIAKADPSVDVQKAKDAGQFRGDLATWNDRYAYSAYAARRGVQPSLVFKHQLVRFTFQITSGSEFESNNRLVVKGLSLEARNVADLCVAGENIGLCNINSTKQTLSLKSLSRGALGDLVEYVVPNASDVIEEGSNVIGESLMVIPNETPAAGQTDKYSMILTMEQDGKTINYPVDLEFSDVTETPAGQTKFTAGYSYRITIKVYGLEDVDLSAELEPWVPGGNIEIDTDDAPEIL